MQQNVLYKTICRATMETKERREKKDSKESKYVILFYHINFGTKNLLDISGQFASIVYDVTIYTGLARK